MIQSSLFVRQRAGSNEIVSYLKGKRLDYHCICEDIVASGVFVNVTHEEVFGD
jgi:hypothetical protein